MDPDRLDQVIRVTDGIERKLRPIGRFIEEKIIDKVSGDIVGPALDIPQKVAGLGPLFAEHVLGQGPGDEPFDFFQEIQQGFDTDPLPAIVPGNFGDHVIIEIHVEDPAPDPPPADRVQTGVFDP